MPGETTGTAATSGAGAAVYTRTANQIINAAARKARVKPGGQDLKPYQSEEALVDLNLLLQNKALRGIRSYTEESSALTLTAKIEFLLVSAGGDLNIDTPLDIIEARLKDDNNNETPLDRMSHLEYQEISDKTATGYPASFYYQFQDDGGHLYFDVVTNATAVTAGYTVPFTYKRPLDAVANLAATIDCPSNLYLPLILELGVLVAVDFGKKLGDAYELALRRAWINAGAMPALEPIKKTSGMI